MRKDFIINIIIIVAANIAIKPLWIFGIDRNVQLHLGDAQYGLYAALINLSIIFNILLDMGLTNLNNKLVAEDGKLMQQNLLNMAVVKMFLFGIYCIVLLVSAFGFRYNTYAIYLLSGIAVIQFLNSFLTFLRSNISAHQRFKTDSLLSIADKLLVILFVGFIFLSPALKSNFTIFQFVYCQIIAYLLVIALAIFYTKKMVNQQLHFSWQQFIPIIKQTIPYAILILLMGIYLRSDLFLLERWLPDGSYQSGMYIKSFRLLDAFNMIGFLFAGMLLPLFVKLLAESKSIFPLLKLSTTLLLPASFAISIFCCYYASDILQLLYHNADAQFVFSFRLVIAIFPAMCVMNIFSTMLTSAGKINTLILITGIGAVASIVFNYFSITYFKNYIGVCIVAIVIQYSVNIAYILGCAKVFGKSIYRIFNFKIIVIPILYFILNFILLYFSISFYMAILINCLMYLPIAYWLGFDDISKLKQYFANK
jgi:O-antigen/teichoic acid export membrane protein